MTYSNVVAIDGPSGSGKSTVAQMLASELSFVYVDTGAMYRALAYTANKKGVSFEIGKELDDFFQCIELKYPGKKDHLVEIDGEDLTMVIRAHHVSKLASQFSRLSPVRSFLTSFQSQLAINKIVVMEGRDIGTVVFPDAFMKFFLIASPEVRANRRKDQLIELGQTEVDVEKILNDIKERDERDKNRKEAPLKQAKDAFALDTSKMDLTEVVEYLKNETIKRAQELKIKLK